MQRTKWFSIVLGMLLVLTLSFVVSAQDGGDTGAEATDEAPVATVEAEATEAAVDTSAAALTEPGLLTTFAGRQFFSGFTGATPANATVLGVAYLEDFNEYTFDLTGVASLNLITLPGQAPQAEATEDATAATPVPAMQQALAECGLVRVYKVSSEGSQDIWPNVTCEGNLLTVAAGGTGHYILYQFSNATALANAPETLSTCIGVFDAEATPEADGSTTTSVQLDESQTCWNFSAITEAMAPTGVTPAPAASADTTDDSGDDDAAEDDATEEPEATAEA